MRNLARLVFLVIAACGAPQNETPNVPVASTERAPICDAAKGVLSALDKPVRVEAHIAPGSPARNGLERLLAEYKRQSNRMLDYAFVEDHEATDFALVISYGNASHTVDPISADGAATEFFVLSTIASLRDRAKGTQHSIGVVVGHGEPRFEDARLAPPMAGDISLAGVVRQHFPEYRLVDVDLQQGEKGVDPSLDGLFVLQPARDWTDRELARIDAAVLAGQTVVFVASAVNITPANTKYPGTLNLHRLDKLLTGYGVDVHRDAVFDFDSEGQFSLGIPLRDGTTTRMRFPAFPSARTGAEKDVVHPIFFRNPRFVFSYASSLGLNEKAQPDARYSVLARTSSRAVAETAEKQSFDFTEAYRPTGKVSEYVLAAAVEGTLKSAFGDTKSTKRAQVAVLASASLFANPVVVEGARSELLDSIAIGFTEKNLEKQILVFKNTLDWMKPFDRALATCALTKLSR